MDEGRVRYILSHHHLHLVLDLGPDRGRDAAGQLIGGALEAIDHLLELRDHGVPRLLLPLLPVLHVGVELLDVCRDEQSLIPFFPQLHQPCSVLCFNTLLYAFISMTFTTINVLQVLWTLQHKPVVLHSCVPCLKLSLIC